MTAQNGPMRVSAKPIPTAAKKPVRKRELWAELCYFYPQYTLEEAAKLSARDVGLLLKTARRKQGELMFNLTQIAAAPHTKKGDGVKKLTQQFKEEAKR